MPQRVVHNGQKSSHTQSASNSHLWNGKSVWELTYHAGSEMVLPSPLIFALISPSFVINPFKGNTKKRLKCPTSSYWEGPTQDRDLQSKRKGYKFFIHLAISTDTLIKFIKFIDKGSLGNIGLMEEHPQGPRFPNCLTSMYFTLYNLIFYINELILWYPDEKEDHPLFWQVVPIYDHRTSLRQQK